MRRKYVSELGKAVRAQNAWLASAEGQRSEIGLVFAQLDLTPGQEVVRFVCEFCGVTK